MGEIAVENFSPLGSIVIERGERRAVTFGPFPPVVDGPPGYSIRVWERRVVSTRPPVIGGWIECPDAGVSLTSKGADKLRRLLDEVFA